MLIKSENAEAFIKDEKIIKHLESLLDSINSCVDLYGEPEKISIHFKSEDDKTLHAISIEDHYTTMMWQLRIAIRNNILDAVKTSRQTLKRKYEAKPENAGLLDG